MDQQIGRSAGKSWRGEEGSYLKKTCLYFLTIYIQMSY